MGTDRVERYSRRTRFLHASVYLATLALLLTGWWLLLGGEGNPSPLARLFGIADTRLHVWLGRALLVLGLAPLVIGRRGVATFVRETFRRDPGDGRWWRRWPAAIWTGRFARHEGHFDPGQRVANVLMGGGLVVLVASGLGLTWLHGGPAFAWLARIHRWTTYLLTVVVAAHVLVAVGVLPGYRGVWRAMHLGGGLRVATGRRVWPGWTERAVGPQPARTGEPAPDGGRRTPDRDAAHGLQPDAPDPVPGRTGSGITSGETDAERDHGDRDRSRSR